MTAPVRVHTVADAALGNSSYLIDAGDGSAIVVDPRRDTAVYQDLAHKWGLRIALVLETHLHADFATGSVELNRLGAEIAAARDADLTLPYRRLTDGDTISVGHAEVRTLATPGHTPEHVAFLLTSDDGDHLFSGGSLIYGGAARTDLVSATDTDRMTRAQFASLQRLAALPPGTWLHPTHGAGSFCSVGPIGTAARTLGDERLGNDLVNAVTEDAFVDALLGRLGSFPPYFLHLREVNRRGPALLASLPEPRPLRAAEAARSLAGGMPLLDIRTLQRWSAGSPLGAVSNVVRPAFAPWLGWIVPFGQPFMLLADSGEEVEEATALARRIGYDHVLGWVDGGIDAWREAGLPTTHVPLASPERAAAVLASGGVLIDVRQRAEVAAGPALPGAINVELGDILAGKTPAASRVVTFCGHGERSATAASVLAARGVDVVNLDGGTDAWIAAGRPTA